MRPSIVGIVNVTEDSFSDGGRYLDPDRALDHARILADEGADYVEFGPASSHPDAKVVGPDLQIERLAPLLAPARGLGTRIAVDASDGAVQRFAIEQGIDMLNDVKGIPDEETLRQLAGSSCRIVAVHSIGPGGRGTRAESTPEEVIASIERFFSRARVRFAAAGIDESRVILDPGLGFFLGGNPACSFRVSGISARSAHPLERRFSFRPPESPSCNEPSAGAQAEQVPRRSLRRHSLHLRAPTTSGRMTSEPSRTLSR